MQERHANTKLESPSKYAFFNNLILNVFLFVTAIISLLVTILVISILCKHIKLETLVTSLALQQVKEVGVVTTQETLQYIECTCKIQWYTILILGILLLGLTFFTVTKVRKLKLFRGHLFSNAVKIMLFILYTKYNVPKKFCQTAGNIHLFKIAGTLTSENVKLKRNRIWDIMEVDWKEVNVNLNGNKITLPRSVTMKFWDKFKIRHLVKREPLLFHIMLKQAFFGLHCLLQIQYKIYQIFFQEMACYLSLHGSFLYGFFQCALLEGTTDLEITVQTLKGIHTFRKDYNAQSSLCSPWHSHDKCFPSLRKKMAAYMEERQTISDPFNQSFPNRPNSSPFAKISKVTLKQDNCKSHPQEKEKK